MEEKVSFRYKFGMVIGRFQPFHIGHYSILNRALEDCEKVVVILGSSQESRLPHNPLSATERELLIADCFPKHKHRLIFIPIEDRATLSNDKGWGEYIFSILKYMDIFPEAIYEGREAVRKNWYDTINVDIIQLSRKTIPISATSLREMLLIGDNNWRHYCPKGAEKHYENLKEILKNVEENRRSY